MSIFHLDCLFSRVPLFWIPYPKFRFSLAHNSISFKSVIVLTAGISSGPENCRFGFETDEKGNHDRRYQMGFVVPLLDIDSVVESLTNVGLRNALSFASVFIGPLTGYNLLSIKHFQFSAHNRIVLCALLAFFVGTHGA